MVLLDRLAQVNDRTKEPTNFRVLLTLVGKRGQVSHGSVKLTPIVVVDGHWILLLIKAVDGGGCNTLQES